MNVHGIWDQLGGEDAQVVVGTVEERREAVAA